MPSSSKPLDVRPGTAVRLRDIGYDEIWLQDWLVADPSRLGLGETKVLAQELSHPKGGSLDILAADGDIYYSIEVQLGEIDASHGFRALDYWARNRHDHPGKTHVAVLMAESAGGRYRSALEALAEHLPLVVVELRSWMGEGQAIVVPEIVIADESLDLGGAAGRAGEKSRTEGDWREQCTDETWKFKEALVTWVTTNLGDVRVDYGPKSYIGIRRGRRVWAPFWPHKAGAALFLPDPDGTRSDEPSRAFDVLSQRLSGAGVEVTWTANYNAGANPIRVRLSPPDLVKVEVQELLRESWEILSPGTPAWSERHPVSVPLEATAAGSARVTATLTVQSSNGERADPESGT